MSHSQPFDSQRGMTLVELMVAIGVTLIVMALTVSIFTAQYQELRKKERRQQNPGIDAAGCGIAETGPDACGLVGDIGHGILF